MKNSIFLTENEHFLLQKYEQGKTVNVYYNALPPNARTFFCTLKLIIMLKLKNIFSCRLFACVKSLISENFHAPIDNNISYHRKERSYKTGSRYI